MRHRRIDGQPARGNAVLVERPGRAEVRSAKKRQPIRLQIRSHHAKASEAEVGRVQLTGRMTFRRFKQVRIVQDFPSRLAGNDMHVDGF